MAFGIYLPFSPLASIWDWCRCRYRTFGWLAGILLSYCVLTQLVKTVLYPPVWSMALMKVSGCEWRLSMAFNYEMLMTGHRLSTSARGSMLRAWLIPLSYFGWLADCIEPDC